MAKILISVVPPHPFEDHSFDFQIEVDDDSVYSRSTMQDLVSTAIIEKCDWEWEVLDN